MLGAIIGDIVGSQYEWRNNKSKNFTYLMPKLETIYYAFNTIKNKRAKNGAR